MYYKNIIPGMKVKCRHGVGYAVRMPVRSDERSNMSANQFVFSKDIYSDEGNYADIENTELLELPKSFETRDKLYKGRKRY